MNQTHASTSALEARLFKKGKSKEAKLCFMGHVLMENRHGLVISPRLTAVTGTAEREAAEAMVAGVPGRHRGEDRVGWVFTLTAAYNLVRIRNLTAAISP